MKADPNYPRMMFHRGKDPVTVYSEEQEAALGGEWQRTIPSQQAADPEPEPAPAKPKRSHHKRK